MLHCKGNQELDFEKVNRAINAQGNMERLTNGELLKLFSFDYGLVNPFSLDPLFLNTPILQVFEKSLELNIIPPYTMMTNAGDLKWAVEFKSDQLIKAVHHFRIEDIIVKDLPINGSQNPKHHKIGILTGNSPESGMLLWRRINQIIRENLGNKFYGDISLPNVVIESIPDMGMSMELALREEETWDAVRNGITSLCKQGATIICIPCNTTQYFNCKIRGITSQYGSQYISMPKVAMKYLEERKIKEFAFLGTKYVTSLDGKWTAFGGFKKFKVVPLNESDIAKIKELAFEVKHEGITEVSLNKLRDLLNYTAKSENIMIALTEISLLLNGQKKKSRKGRNYIDTLELLAESVANEYMNLSKQ